MRLTPNQQKALTFNTHVCVTAGAGSGKTTVLVERYLKILHEADASPREIVAITFTEKAATEMKERIIERLNELDSRKFHNRSKFQEQMTTAPISTIHAFCSRILREFPFQARVPANFGILQGIDTRLLLRATLQEELKTIATEHHHELYSKLRHLLYCCAGRRKLETILTAMLNQRETIERLKQQLYDEHSNAEIRELWETLSIEQLLQNGGTDESEQSVQAWVKEWIHCLNTVLKVAKGKNAPEIRNLTDQLTANLNTDIAKPTQLQQLRKIEKLILNKSGKIAKNYFLGKGTDITAIESEINFLGSAAKELRNTPPINDDDDALIQTTRHLLALYTHIETAYQRAKLEQGKLDYTDLQLKTRELLKENKEIRRTLENRYKYFMIDEYQDTNPLQFELVMLLTNKLQHGNLFIVGDVKQGIYGFRGADIRVFNQTREKICESNGMAVSLSENFRSLRDDVGFVNYFFQRLMHEGTESEFEVAYEPLVQARTAPLGTEAESAVANGSIEIILGNKGEERVNENELIATRIKNMITEKVAVINRDENGESLRQIEYGDIAILIRNRTHLPDLERALLDKGVPYLTTGGIGFYQRQEIYDIWNYLQFLDAPIESHVALAAILRGPFFGISDTELYEISLQHGDSFWEKTEARLQNLVTQDNVIGTPENPRKKLSDESEISSQNLQLAVGLLKKHLQLAQRIPINQLILTIVQETGIIGTITAGPQGQQRWANYQKLLDLARNFQQEDANLDGSQTLTRFIDFLAILMDEEPREGQAPIQANRTAVQIMTIHAAKGLQFPIVVLPGLDRRGQIETEPFIDEQCGIGFTSLNPDDDYKKRDPSIIKLMKNRANAKADAEKKRIFYVGTTRASDRLILSGTLFDSQKPRSMLKSLCTHLGLSQQTSLSIPVELEAFSDNSTKQQHFNLEIPIIRCLPESAEPASNQAEIISPELSQLPAPPLSPSTTGAYFSVPELSNYARCPLRYHLENVLRIPPIRPINDECNEFIQPSTAQNQPDTPDWDETETGRAVHYILSQIRQKTDVRQLERLIQYYKESIRSDIRENVNAFLTSELGQIALVSEQTYCERQIHIQLGEHIIGGRIDRLFKHPTTGHWQAIDYKTIGTVDKLGMTSSLLSSVDEHSGEESLIALTDENRPQVELYALLVHRSYPEQPELTINLFFTHLNQSVPLQFSRNELQQLANRWTETIASLQLSTYLKNPSHCPSCPYADDNLNQRCIITTS